MVGSSIDSVSRVVGDRIAAKDGLDPTALNRKFNAVTKPGSMAGTMKKAGIALIATPDPITGIIGVPLLASSYIMKRKEPLSLTHLAEETRKVMRDLQSLSL